MVTKKYCMALFQKSNWMINKKYNIRNLTKMIIINNKTNDYLLYKMSEELNNECSYYSYSYIDFFVPPIDILNDLCKSLDKTYLFIISLARIIILVIIAGIYYYILGINGILIYVYSLLLIYIIINTIILFLIILKKTKQNKDAEIL